MKLSIVVLTHNRLAALRECLVRIQNNTIETDAEVLVVNNGSTDGTREWLDVNAGAGPLPVTAIHRETNEGVCARNYALEVAAGDFVAQVDDDVMVMAGWDQVLLAPMLADPNVGATGQEGFYQEQTWERQPWSAGLIDDRRRPGAGDFCDWLTGFVWMWRARRSDGERMFLYDTEMEPFWTEESEAQLHIRAAGYRLMKVRDVAVHRSLPHVRTFAADVAMAERNFNYVKRKWKDNPLITFEGPRVGLR